ncbi:hypothetical protein J6590_060393, partial [Homalodisca vitripennis]
MVRVPVLKGSRHANDVYILSYSFADAREHGFPAFDYPPKKIYTVGQRGGTNIFSPYLLKHCYNPASANLTEEVRKHQSVGDHSHNRQKASETTGSHCSQERLVTDQCKPYRRTIIDRRPRRLPAVIAARREEVRKHQSVGDHSHNRQKASETTGSHCSQERLVTDQCKPYRRTIIDRRPRRLPAVIAARREEVRKQSVGDHSHNRQKASETTGSHCARREEVRKHQSVGDHSHNRQKASETTGSHCSQERLVTDQCKPYRRTIIDRRPRRLPAVIAARR